MSSPHTISKESTTAEIARHGTKRPDGKRKRTPQACANVKKSCHRSCSRQTIYPLTEFRSSIPFCFRVALFVLRLAVFVQTFLLFFFFSIIFFPSFLLFTTSTMTFGFWGQEEASFPVVVQHVLCTKLQSAGARVVSKRYRDALEQGKERAIKLGARYSCCKAEKKSRAS